MHAHVEWALQSVTTDIPYNCCYNRKLVFPEGIAALYERNCMGFSLVAPPYPDMKHGSGMCW